MGRAKEHETVEEWRSLDVRRLYREHCLTNNRSFNWFWQSGDGSKSSITIHCIDQLEIRLSYTLTRYGERTEHNYPVILSWTKCHFGNQRVWFHCPNCQKRVAKLYGPNSIFACRHCFKLNYRSQQIGKRDRWFERALSLHSKLKSPWTPLDEASGYVDRPKWMRLKTFRTLKQQLVLIESMAIKEIQRLMKKLDSYQF